jgi:phosphinothricin acetyltransferase
MDIRACTVDDIADVRAIYAHHVRTGFGTFEEEPPSLAEMRQRFDALVAQDCPFRVAVIDGRRGVRLCGAVPAARRLSTYL